MTADVFDPEVAIAMARCIAARLKAEARPQHPPPENHPRRCDWEDYPLPYLVASVESFNRWADHRRVTYTTSELTTWDALPRAEQERRIVEAQGIEEALPPGGVISSGDHADEDRDGCHVPGLSGSNVQPEPPPLVTEAPVEPPGHGVEPPEEEAVAWML